MRALISAIAATAALTSVGYGASTDPTAFVQRYVEPHEPQPTAGSSCAITPR